MPKIERPTSPPSSPRVQSVARPVEPAPAIATAKAPATSYGGQAAAPSELVNPGGSPVSKSAEPSALWGEAAPKANDLDPAAFAKLSPAEQRTTLMSLRAERNQLSAEIVQRLEKLDVKWNNSRLVTRTEALREYQESTQHLDPATKKELDALLQRSEASQRKINELRVKIDRLPKSPEAKKGQVELRNQLARELRHARDEQSKVVKAATAVVDAKGLKTDRLASTEQIIDPSAPAPGSGQTLLEKIGRFLKLDWFFSSIGQAFATVQEHFSQAIHRRGETWAEETKVNREKRVVEERQQDALRSEKKLEQADEEPEIVSRARAALARLSVPGPAAANPASRA